MPTPGYRGTAGRSGYRAGAQRRAGSVRASRPRLSFKRPKPVFTRGPKALQSTLLGVGNPTPFPPMPADWPGSLPEWALYWAHLKRGLTPEVDFTYQSPFAGGRLQFGGAVLDFVEYTAPVAINVQGLFYHYERGTAAQALDLAQRVQVAQYGLLLIFVDEDDALRDPYHYLAEALLGIDHSRLGRGT